MSTSSLVDVPKFLKNCATMKIDPLSPHTSDRLLGRQLTGELSNVTARSGKPLSVAQVERNDGTNMNEYE